MKIARNERGFTLIELMVVVIIIGILAAIAIPIMSNQTDKAKVKRAVSELKSMKTIIDVWVNDPSQNKAGLAAPPLADVTVDATHPVASDGIVKVLVAGGIDNTKISDPWGHSYKYELVGETGYILYSNGSKTATSDEISVTNADNPQEAQTKDEGAEGTVVDIGIGG